MQIIQMQTKICFRSKGRWKIPRWLEFPYRMVIGSEIVVILLAALCTHLDSQKIPHTEQIWNIRGFSYPCLMLLTWYSHYLKQQVAFMPIPENTTQIWEFMHVAFSGMKMLPIYCHSQMQAPPLQVRHDSAWQCSHSSGASSFSASLNTQVAHVVRGSHKTECLKFLVHSRPIHCSCMFKCRQLLVQALAVKCVTKGTTCALCMLCWHNRQNQNIAQYEKDHKLHQICHMLLNRCGICKSICSL